MMIKNLTKKTILATKVRHCHSVFSKLKGLMFAKPLKDTALIFHFKKEKIISLHMFLVFYPIDVLWLDKNRQVVQLKEHFRPFHVIIAEKPAQYIVELPDSAITKSKTRAGDIVDF